MPNGKCYVHTEQITQMASTVNRIDGKLDKLGNKLDTTREEQIEMRTRLKVIWGALGVIGGAVVGVIAKLLSA